MSAGNARVARSFSVNIKNYHGAHLRCELNRSERNFVPLSLEQFIRRSVACKTELNLKLSKKGVDTVRSFSSIKITKSANSGSFLRERGRSASSTAARAIRSYTFNCAAEQLASRVALYLHSTDLEISKLVCSPDSLKTKSKVF